jgi:hypothetical protein
MFSERIGFTAIKTDVRFLMTDLLLVNQCRLVKMLFQPDTQFQAFDWLACYFLFLEKKKVTKENSRQKRNSPFLSPYPDYALVLLWLQHLFFMPVLLVSVRMTWPLCLSVFEP